MNLSKCTQNALTCFRLDGCYNLIQFLQIHLVFQTISGTSLQEIVKLDVY